MIAYAKEFLCQLVNEVDALLALHYQELAKNQDRVALNPDWERYAAMERAQSLLVYTARDGSRLVGYACFFCSPHPHYKDLQLVSNDVLFLEKSFRTGRTGIRFIQFCETQIRKEYQQSLCLTWHAKEHTALSGMLCRMGYGVQDIVLSKLI